MQFRTHLMRLEEIGAKIGGLTKAFWFIEKAGLSGDLRKQVVAAAGGEYDYPKLRKALMAIVPRVNKEEDMSCRPNQGNRHWKTKNYQSARQVHATTDDSVDDPEKNEMEDEGQDTDQLEGELEVLMTQAAKKRAQIEKARGFTKNESAEDRERRIKSMKERMPCSACKAHGKTVYGHWHGDATCPYHKDNKSQNVLAVIEEQHSDSESDQDDFFTPDGVYMATAETDQHQVLDEGHHEVWIGSLSGHEKPSGSRHTLALSDTCCARTVAGEKWMRAHLKHLRKQQEDVFVIDESRPFRFGAGPRIMSRYAVIMPISIPQAKKWAHLRVSVVDQDVPLLISKGAMKQLGVVLDLEHGKVEFKKLEAAVPPRETKTGLCGFDINVEASRKRCECPDPNLLEYDCEVVLQGHGRDVEQEIMMTSEKISPHLEQRDQEAHSRKGTSQIVQQCESCAKQMIKKGDFSYEALCELMRKLPIGQSTRHRQIHGGQGQANNTWVAGLYAHGKWIATTKRSVVYPNVIRYVNLFMRQRSDRTWTSFAINKNVLTGPHCDMNNSKQEPSITVTFGAFEGGQMWVHESGESTTSNLVWKEDSQRGRLPGKLVSTFREPYEFSPHVLHATQPWSGERWCLTMYTVRDAAQVDQDIWDALRRLKFPLKRRSASRTFGVVNEPSTDAHMSSHREPQERREDMCHATSTPQLQQRSSSETSEFRREDEQFEDRTDRRTTTQGGLCPGDRVSLQRVSGGLEDPHGGSAEGAVRSGEAEEEVRSSAGRVEEVRSRGSSEFVRREGGRGSPEGSRRTLGEVETPAVRFGTRDVGGRDKGSHPSRGGHRVSSPVLLGMHDTDDDPNQPTGRNRLLRVSEIPQLPSDPSAHSRRASHGSGPERAGDQEGGRQEDRQEEEIPSGIPPNRSSRTSCQRLRQRRRQSGRERPPNRRLRQGLPRTARGWLQERSRFPTHRTRTARRRSTGSSTPT